MWGDGKIQVSPCDKLHEANLLQLNVEKAEKELGIKPVYSAEEAVKKTTDWYKAYYKNLNMMEFTEMQINEFVCAAQNKNIEWSLQ